MSQFRQRWQQVLPRVVAAIAVAAVVGGVTSACGKDTKPQAADTPVALRFSWWGSDTRAGLTTKAIKEFEAAHTNIKVQTDYAAYAPYWQKIATETAGGNPPDVIQMDYRYLSEYGRRNALLDLGKQKAALPLANIEPALAPSGKVDGKTVAVPFGQNTVAIAVDTTTLGKLGVEAPKAGMSWTDFAAWAKQVNTKSGGKVYGVSDMGYAEDVFETWLRQSGKTLFKADGKFGFNSDDLTRFWTLWQDMVKSGAATPADISNAYDGTTAKSALVQGKSAAEFIFDNTLGATQAATKNTLQLVGFPTDGSNSGQYYKPTMLLSAAARSQHPKEAAQLIDFLVNSESAGKVLGVDRGLPANTKVRTVVIGSLTGPSQIVVAYEDSVKASLSPTPAAPPKGDGEVKNLFQSTYQGVTSGKTAIAAAVSSFLQQAQQAIGA
jgi:multiple sugar transport system substrate-binding protein